MITRLTSADIAKMRALNALFADAFDDPATYGHDWPDDAYLATTLAAPHIIVLVAQDGDAFIGGLVAYELPKLELARSEIYIYDLAVASTHRRRGIATALIRALNPIAQSCGAYVSFVQADHGDAPAIALYTKLGVREDVLHFDIAVDDVS